MVNGNKDRKMATGYKNILMENRSKVKGRQEIL
jgi:hypothetical protein